MPCRCSTASCAATNNRDCLSSSVLSTELKYSEINVLPDYLIQFLDSLLFKTFHFGNRLCFLPQVKVLLECVECVSVRECLSLSADLVKSVSVTCVDV